MTGDLTQTLDITAADLLGQPAAAIARYIVGIDLGTSN